MTQTIDIPGIIIETPDETTTDSTMKDFAVSAIGAGAITCVVAAGTILIVAGCLKLVTWALGLAAGVLAAIAPWAAILLGICAFSAYSK